MRVFLISSVLLLGAVATASPPVQDGGSSMKRYTSASSTENYRWYGEREQSHHWWDRNRYYGHDGEDDEDEDQDGDDDGRGRGTWRHGGDKRSWNHGDGDSAQKHSGRNNYDGWYGHDHEGGGKWRGHGQVDKSRDGHSSYPTESGGKYGHSYDHGDKDHGRWSDDVSGEEHDKHDQGKKRKHEADGKNDEGDKIGGGAGWYGHGRDGAGKGGDQDGGNWHGHGHEDKAPASHVPDGDSKYGHGHDSTHHQGNKDHGRWSDDASGDEGNGKRGSHKKHGGDAEGEQGNDDSEDDGKDRAHGHRGDRDKASHRGDRGGDSPHANKHSETDGDGRKDDQDSEPDVVPTTSTSLPVAQQLRTDTEAFVSKTLGWINGIAGDDATSTIVIDTTFSLTKSEFADLGRGPCGSTVLATLSPLLVKFIASPQDINLVDDDAKEIAWKPSVACTKGEKSLEIEGGVYGSFQVACMNVPLLNASIAASGSTPTIQGQAVEDSSFYIDVDILNGQIRASEAQGSISGVLENRHHPENAVVLHKNWTAVIEQCAAAKKLSVVGVVGGGWTMYTKVANDSSASDAYQMSAVGYTESFEFSFPTDDDDALLPAVPNTIPIPPSVNDSVPIGTETGAPSVAASGAAAYVEAGVVCRHRSDMPQVCAGHAIMSQLTSFFQSSTNSPMTKRIHSPATVPVALVGVFLVVAVAAVAVKTERRRSGYRSLEIQSHV